MPRYKARIWVDVIITAPDEVIAKTIAKLAVKTFTYQTICSDQQLEEYDMQFEGILYPYNPE